MRIGLIVLGLLCVAPAFAQEQPSFTIYFDLNSARPSEAAREIVERAANAAKQREAEGRFDHVKVIGYADTSGSDGRARDEFLCGQRRSGMVLGAYEDGLPLAQRLSADRVEFALISADGAA